MWTVNNLAGRDSHESAKASFRKKISKFNRIFSLYPVCSIIDGPLRQNLTIFCLILPSFSIPQLLGNELLISFSTLQLDTSSVENTYFPHCLVLKFSTLLVFSTPLVLKFSTLQCLALRESEFKSSLLIKKKSSNFEESFTYGEIRTCYLLVTSRTLYH